MDISPSFSSSSLSSLSLTAADEDDVVVSEERDEDEEAPPLSPSGVPESVATELQEFAKLSYLPYLDRIQIIFR